MNNLDVDAAALWGLVQKTCKSRIGPGSKSAPLRPVRDSCFYYLPTTRTHAGAVYKIQSTLARSSAARAGWTTPSCRWPWTRLLQVHLLHPLRGLLPLGIDTGVMFSYLRGLLFSQGSRLGNEDRTGMHRVFQAQMDVTTEDWVDTCSWMAEETADDWPGLEIPVDKENADIIYTVNAREPKHYPEDIAQAASFPRRRRKLDVPSQGWEETSLAMFAATGRRARSRWKASMPPWTG